jgi:transcriptional regulator with XRE-family HTH domain
MSLNYETFCAGLGAAIRARRLGAGLTQEQLAVKVGLHRNSVNRYEHGDDMPIMAFVRMCVALGTHAGDVLDEVMNGGK